MRKTVIPAVAALTLLATPVPASAKIDNEAVASIVNSTPTVVEQNTRSGQCRPNAICIWSEINYTGSKMEYLPSSGCIQALTGSTRPGARSIINNSKRRMMLFAEPSCPQDWMIVIEPGQKLAEKPFREPHSIMSMTIYR
jgi:hypothetical protein